MAAPMIGTAAQRPGVASLRATKGTAYFATDTQELSVFTGAAWSSVISGGFLAGTALLPSIAFAGDPDTGFYNISANVLGVAAAGAEVARFSATTLQLAGTLSFSTAASRIVPGATSLSLRNNANNADNFIVTDAGAGTLRAGMVATSFISNTPTGAGIGYGAGAGGAVTQITNRSTGVTINKLTGAITTDATSLAAGAEATFTVTNSTVAIGDTVIVSARSGQTAGTSIPAVTAVAAGSFDITLTNLHASTADTGAMIINFAVIKAVSA